MTPQEGYPAHVILTMLTPVGTDSLVSPMRLTWSDSKPACLQGTACHQPATSRRRQRTSPWSPGCTPSPSSACQMPLTPQTHRGGVGTLRTQRSMDRPGSSLPAPPYPLPGPWTASLVRQGGTCHTERLRGSCTSVPQLLMGPGGLRWLGTVSGRSSLGTARAAGGGHREGHGCWAGGGASVATADPGHG